MDTISIQDRDAYNSFQAIVEDIVNDDRNTVLFSWGYIQNKEDGRTAEMNVFIVGNFLEFMLGCACVGCHTTPVLVMVTQAV